MIENINMENVEQEQALDLAENLESGETALELTEEEFSDEVEAVEEFTDTLGLTEEEKEVYTRIENDLPDNDLAYASGEGKVKGDCVSTTCTHTMASYWCSYTKCNSGKL